MERVEGKTLVVNSCLRTAHVLVTRKKLRETPG